MAKYVKATDGTVSTQDNGLLDDIVGGIKAPFMKEGEYIDSKSALYGLLGYGVAITAGVSVLTRRRAASGAKPMAGVFF